MEAGKAGLFSNDLDQAPELDARANRKAPGRSNHCRPRFLWWYEGMRTDPLWADEPLSHQIRLFSRPHPVPPGGQRRYCRAGPGHHRGPGTECPDQGDRPDSCRAARAVAYAKILLRRRAEGLVRQSHGLHRRRLPVPPLRPPPPVSGVEGWRRCVLRPRRPGDTLRLEAGLKLPGQDMDETLSPLESGLAWTVAWEPAERDFIGRSALEDQRARWTTSLRGPAAERAKSPAPAPAGTHESMGEITSGGFAPTLQRSIAFALVVPGSVKC